MNHFILAVTDGLDLEGKRIRAVDIAISRIALGKWPLYLHTPNRQLIQVGDRCLIYLAGRSPDAQNFFASGLIADIDNSRRAPTALPLDLVGQPPIAILNFTNCSRFLPLIPIRPLLARLQFTAGVKKWGIMIQGGCRKISDQDFQTVIKSRSEEVSE